MTRRPTHGHHNGGSFAPALNGAAHNRVAALPVLTVAGVVGLVGCTRHEAAVGAPCWELHPGVPGPKGGAGVCGSRLQAYTAASQNTTTGARA